MSDKDNVENHTERALKTFQCSIFFCNKDFQSSCYFSVSFSAINCNSDYSEKFRKVIIPCRMGFYDVRFMR